MEDAPGSACDERLTISSHAMHTLWFQTTMAASQSKILAAHRHEEITPRVDRRDLRPNREPGNGRNVMHEVHVMGVCPAGTAEVY